MKRKNFPAEQCAERSADGGIPAERALSEYQSRQYERMLEEARLRTYASTIIKKGGNII